VREVHEAEHEIAGRLRHGLGQEDARHERVAREMAFEDRARLGHGRARLEMPPGAVERDHAIDHLEIFEAHPGREP
jgi:hypothetical protein